VLLVGRGKVDADCKATHRQIILLDLAEGMHAKSDGHIRNEHAALGIPERNFANPQVKINIPSFFCK
jgi:hypothetical protein